MSASISDLERSNDPVAPTAALHVEVIADLVCPFCYLGKRRLDADSGLIGLDGGRCVAQLAKRNAQITVPIGEIGSLGDGFATNLDGRRCAIQGDVRP